MRGICPISSRGGSRRLEGPDGGLAGAAILLGIEGNLLPFVETAEAGALQGGGVNKHVLAARCSIVASRRSNFLFIGAGPGFQTDPGLGGSVHARCRMSAFAVSSPKPRLLL